MPKRRNNPAVENPTRGLHDTPTPPSGSGAAASTENVIPVHHEKAGLVSIEQAIKNKWPVTENLMRAILARCGQLIVRKGGPDRNMLRASEVVMAAQRLNIAQADYLRDNPDTDDSTLVLRSPLPMPNIEKRSNRKKRKAKRIDPDEVHLD